MPASFWFRRTFSPGMPYGAIHTNVWERVHLSTYPRIPLSILILGELRICGASGPRTQDTCRESGRLRALRLEPLAVCVP
jgi:hypothetical protein